MTTMEEHDAPAERRDIVDYHLTIVIALREINPVEISRKSVVNHVSDRSGGTGVESPGKVNHIWQ